MSEQRGSRRTRALKSGKISFGGGAISCTIRNISESGAQLAVESPLGIPTEFMLVIPSDGVSRPCRVVWRSGNRIGMRFAGSGRAMKAYRSLSSVSSARAVFADVGAMNFGSRYGRQP